MGVYLNTFRTEHRNAWLDSKTFVVVHAMKYLCRAGDEDTVFAHDRKHAKLLQTNIDGCTSRFNEIKPTHIALVHKDDWEGAVVHANPTSAVYYDSDPFPAGPIVGFLARKGGRGWTISTSKMGQDRPMYCGLQVDRVYIEEIVDGKIVRTNQKYRFSNGVEMTEEQFQAWHAKAQPEYLAACQKARDEEQKRSDEAAAAKQQKLAAKDAEITAAMDNINKLRQERQHILTYG